MTSPLSARRVGRLAIGAVGASLAFIPLAGVASAATADTIAYGNGPAVSCTASYSNGAVTVTATGFNGSGPVTFVYGAGSTSGSGSGTSFTTPVAGVPAGTVFTATVSEEIIVTNKDGSSTDSRESCTASVTIGSSTSGSGTGTTSPTGGGGGSAAATPVSFTAPVSVAGTTITRAATTKSPAGTTKKTSVLGESVTRPATTPANAGGAAAAPAAGLAFTGSDDIVGGSILGLSLVAGGAGFVLASRKRSRRRQRHTFA